jgi:hypothetical protein
MAKQKIIISILMSLLIISCSKGTQKTSAKLKLNLSGITNLSSGIGSGGAILFGKNSAGDTFGKKINATEEDLELPNGAWVFYALMWGNDSTAMNGKVHCGKSINQLNGTAATISMSLTNDNCTDAEFSGGKSYLASTLNRFADIFIEECDEINATTGFSCGKQNQGSALSYRFVFNNYKKTSAGFFIEGESLVSECKLVTGAAVGTNVYNSGLPINFPSGGIGTPFIGSIEFFMSSNNCDINDPKGVHRFPLRQGLATSTAPEHHVLVSSNSCTPSTPEFTTGTDEDKKNKCEQFFGTWSGSCTGPFLPVVTRFGASACVSPVPSNVAIKHQFMLPKLALCAPYINNSSLIGSNPFAGGEGSAMRPYKICTEWQLNQVGEKLASSGFISASFKLMNDLDMNKTDFGPYAKPSCVGEAGSLLKDHHNLNPINKVIDSDCTTSASITSYSGVFDGNNKTIRNGRIMAKTMSTVGFVRQLGTSGQIRNLNFVNLEVEGVNNVGGIVGDLLTSAVISNVKIEKGDMQASGDFVGGIVGSAAVASKIDHVKVLGVDVRGNNHVGGLVGSSGASIDKAMFRGSIEQHNNIAGSVGGLVGDAIAGSNITLSFSEGNIISAVQYTGGIAGSNAGVINNAYSSMYINSRYSNTNATVGGIVGYNTNSSISNVYSDSILETTGGGTTPIKDGISTGSPPSNNTLCFSSQTTTTSNCNSGAAKTFSQMRSGGNFPSYPGWKSDVVGALPRLAWEFETSSRKCLLANNLISIAAQAALGRGTSASPYIVCSSDQLKALSGAAVNTYAVLGEDVNISDWSYTNMISTFSGVFDGNNFAIYGLNINSTQAINHGIFANNTGVIKNVSVFGSKIVHTGTSGAAGILAGVNSGTIQNVELIGNLLDGVNYVGFVAGSNSGTINDVLTSEGQVRGQSYVGGVVGGNSGNLTRATSRGMISDLASYPAYFKFGGIAGANTSGGVIDQAIFAGRIENLNQATGGAATLVNIGGIAGFNDGTISNAMTENYSQVSVKNYGNVGGLIGNNIGNVYKSFTLGSLNFNSPPNVVSGGASFHQLIGANGGSFDSNTYFLENHAGSIIGNPTAASSAPCSGTTLSFIGFNPAYLTVATPIADLITPINLASNGDTLKTYSYFAAPTIDYIVEYNGTCAASAAFTAFKKFEGDTTGKMMITDFDDISLFSDYNIAYTDTANPANSTKHDELLEYYKAQMENRAPTLTPPVWELESGDGHPRLIQVDKH